MGLFDSFAGMAKTAILDAVEGQAATIIGHIAENGEGGLGGLLGRLQAGGLGAHVDSWLAEGHNLPVSPDQIRAALSDEHVTELAQSMGLPARQLLQSLADHLPALVSQHAASAS